MKNPEFKRIKLLQTVGVSVAKTAKAMNRSTTTVAYIFKSSDFEDYKQRTAAVWQKNKADTDNQSVSPEDHNSEAYSEAEVSELVKKALVEGFQKGWDQCAVKFWREIRSVTWALRKEQNPDLKGEYDN